MKSFEILFRTIFLASIVFASSLVIDGEKMNCGNTNTIGKDKYNVLDGAKVCLVFEDV